MLDFVGIEREKFPEIHRSAEIVGEYKGIKVVTGAIDQIAGAIGAGVVKKGVMIHCEYGRGTHITEYYKDVQWKKRLAGVYRHGRK